MTTRDATVLIVDDDAERRRALRALVAAATGFVLVGEAASGEEAIEALLEVDADLALVDAEMPGLDGYETSRRLLAARPATTVIVLTAGEPSRSRSDAHVTPRSALTAASLEDLRHIHQIGYSRTQQ